MQKGKKKALATSTDVQMAPPTPDVRLWCVLEGSLQAFVVSVSLNERVDDLKNKIKEAAPNTLKAFDAHQLQLFQVCTFRLHTAHN